MKIVLLVLLLIPVFIFQAFICNEIVLNYKSQKEAEKLKARSKTGIKKNKIYYKVK